MLDLDFEPTRFVSGAERIAQQFVAELLCLRGSMVWQPLRGCHFVPQLYRASTEFDIFVAFATARTRISSFLRQANPPGERYRDAKLLHIKLTDDDAVVLGIRIETDLGPVYIETPSLKRCDDDRFASSADRGRAGQIGRIATNDGGA